MLWISNCHLSHNYLFVLGGEELKMMPLFVIILVSLIAISSPESQSDTNEEYHVPNNLQQQSIQELPRFHLGSLNPGQPLSHFQSFFEDEFISGYKPLYGRHSSEQEQSGILLLLFNGHNIFCQIWILIWLVSGPQQIITWFSNCS